jgi:hypothetical protein
MWDLIKITKAKRAGNMAQVNHLPGKHKALSSTPSTIKKQKKKNDCFKYTWRVKVNHEHNERNGRYKRTQMITIHIAAKNVYNWLDSQQIIHFITKLVNLMTQQ